MLLIPHPSWIEIDLGQFRRNIAAIRRLIGKRLFCLPVKANAYGHGLCEMGRAAVGAGVDYLGVSCLQEGVELRQSGIASPILVFGAIHEEQIEDLLRFNLEVSISSAFKADLAASVCRKMGKTMTVHLKVDTGMRRVGVRGETAISLFAKMKQTGCFEMKGIYSHLAMADMPEEKVAKEQIAEFRQLLAHPLFAQERLICHLANSGGALHYPDSHLDMVRCGIMAFGYPPTPVADIAPCFSLKSKVSYFKVAPEGAGISYGHTYRTRRQTRIVTVPIGYGDGYRRALSNRGCVLIRGKRYPIAGMICMDQLMVDIGDDEAYVGDEVVLIGKQGKEEIPLSEIAALCDTISYEILCGFNGRLPRVYKDVETG